MPKLTIDGMQVEVPKGATLLEAAQALGVHIPRYCYHPKLTVAGSCRMCVVEIDKFPKLMTACSTEAAEGMAVRTDTPKVKKARRDTLEFLLINHPLDCPICDQAGECGLQDYYMEHGLHASRFPQEDKILRAKRREAGPHLVLDNERCILCTRCVRFCEEVTRTNELTVAERGDESFIEFREPVTNPYSLNIADICPVGAFTSREFRFRKRAWFLKKTPSVCSGCATGCLTEVHHEGGEIFRIQPRPSADGSGWLCDAGRLDFQSLYGAGRLTASVVRNAQTETEPALRETAHLLEDLLRSGGPSAVAVAGSPWLSLEDNIALAELARALKTPEFCFDYAAEARVRDGILMNSDPAPNGAGLALVRAKYGGLSEADFRAQLRSGSVKAVIMDARDLDRLQPGGAASLVVFAFRREALPPRPAAALACAGPHEAPGVFVNWKGEPRRAAAPVSAPAGLAPVWSLVNRLSSYLAAPVRIADDACALQKAAALAGRDPSELGGLP